MNKLIGILSSAVVCTAAWVICNFIALGTEANYSAVVTASAVSGIIIGIGCAVFKSVNPIFMGVMVTMFTWLGLGSYMIYIGVANTPVISLELVWIAAVMSAIGAASGFGYKLGARV